MAKKAFDVAVVGSLHLDIMVRGPRLPRLDETVIGETWGSRCGGKGGNQAVAAARAGASTVFVGRVGADEFGRRLLAHLDAAGIDRTRIIVDGSAASGMSVAIEDADGGYGAVVVSGANRCIDVDQLEGLASRVLLLQNEVMPAINVAAARLLKATGTVVMHNMAPFVPVDEELLRLTDVVVVNLVEADGMTDSVDPQAAARMIAARGVDAIVTAGARGCVVALRDGTLAEIAATPVKVVSSHGAGDCFCGTLAAEFSKDLVLLDAVRAASAAAARLVSGGGAAWEE